MIAFEHQNISGTMATVRLITEPLGLAHIEVNLLMLRGRTLDGGHSTLFDDTFTPPLLLWCGVSLPYLALNGGDKVPRFCQCHGRIIETATGKTIMEGPAS